MSSVVIDSSAAVAILLSEPEGERALTALDQAEERLLSAATLVDVAIVLEARLGARGHAIADRFVRDGSVEVVPLDREQADRGIEGWRRYGKGRHPASLNLGDCFTYGLSIATGSPILCVGGDFAQTDAEVVTLSE